LPLPGDILQLKSTTEELQLNMKLRSSFKQALPVLALTLATSQMLPALTVYSENFEGAGPFPEWSGSGAVGTTGGLSAFGFGSNHLFNNTTGASTLTLTGLAAHTQLTLNFDLALWDSIDIGADLFQVAVDAAFLVNTTDFGNYFPADNISHGPGVHITDPFTAFAVPNYGYNSGFRDAGRRVTGLTLAHSSSTAVITFHYPNSQGGTDEAFGVDNVVVQTNTVPAAVPEPSTLVLSLACFGAVALYRRRLTRSS
jgi:hypothetical protein